MEKKKLNWLMLITLCNLDHDFKDTFSDFEILLKMILNENIPKMNKLCKIYAVSQTKLTV